MMRRVRSRRSSAAAFAFGALTLSMILVGLAAWALADNQSHQRRDLRNRYVDRTVVAASLVDALFRVAFTSQARDLSTRYSGNVTSADADALVKRSQSSYAAFADPSGRVIARSRAAPAGAFPAMPSVVRVALRRGFSVGDPRNGVVNSVIAFQTPAGPRLLVQGSPVGVFRSFLAGTLRPLPTLKGSVALVLDDHGTSLGGLAYGGRPVSAPAALRRAARPLNRSQASFTQNGRKIFVGSAQLPGTTWKIVVTAPEKELYASINGAARWVEWGILVLGALALVGVSFLLYRVVKTTDRLRRSNEQLEASRLSLEERAGELERSNADLEQFAYAASHDLSEPLRTVAGFSQLLQQRYRGRLAADADEYIGHMAAGGPRRARAARPGPAEPHLQRDQVHRAGGHPRRPSLGHPRGRRRVARLGPRQRHRGRGELDGHLQDVRPPARRGRVPRHGHRAGAGQAHHRGARRAHLGRARGRRRKRLLVHPLRRRARAPGSGGVIRILLVEDSRADQLLIREALDQVSDSHVVETCSDGEAALARLRSSAPRPHLVLLDLNLPRKDGRAVLSEVKQDPELRAIPVIILTTSSAPADVSFAYMHCANSYVRKPLGLDALVEAAAAIRDFWLRTATLPPAEPAPAS